MVSRTAPMAAPVLQAWLRIGSGKRSQCAFDGRKVSPSPLLHCSFPLRPMPRRRSLWPTWIVQVQGADDVDKRTLFLALHDPVDARAVTAAGDGVARARIGADRSHRVRQQSRRASDVQIRTGRAAGEFTA